MGKHPVDANDPEEEGSDEVVHCDECDCDDMDPCITSGCQCPDCGCLADAEYGIGLMAGYFGYKGPLVVDDDEDDEDEDED